MWKEFVEKKGDHLVCLMQATDKGAGYLEEDKRKPPSVASPWNGDLKNEMALWGWHEAESFEKDYECDFERRKLEVAFKGLGLNARAKYEWDDEKDVYKPGDGHNDCISVIHYNENDYEDPKPEDHKDKEPEMKNIVKQKYKVKDKEYTATGGFFEFAMNKVEGAIIGMNLDSPVNAVRDGHRSWGRAATPEELPAIRRCSDIYWAYWVRDNPNPKNLRIYGAYNVVNDATSLLAARAFRNNKIKELSKWPGAAFTADTDEGKALIGSPIGASIAHMLIQHKAELGIKHITKVTVITNDVPPETRFKVTPRPYLHIFFHIEDVPADKVTDDESGEKMELDLAIAPKLEPDYETKIIRALDKAKDILRVHTLRL
ncbi:hypothetical protein BKA66DRAFT_511037 [Pyrenochaeta sp. MPI-SDFR-AT-0127]|nr:hypothetical protein BKA66DRAFT_511037 [Pyrenochaeta sp. MPI-SDFR-AT-0127]